MLCAVATCWPSWVLRDLRQCHGNGRASAEYLISVRTEPRWCKSSRGQSASTNEGVSDRADRCESRLAKAGGSPRSRISRRAEGTLAHESCTVLHSKPTSRLVSC